MFQKFLNQSNKILPVKEEKKQSPIRSYRDAANKVSNMKFFT
jgi:hypothetical protein